MRACSVCSQRHLDRDCPNRPPPSSATVSSPPVLRPPDNSPDAAAIEHRDAQVPQTCNVHTSDDEDDDAPNPGHAAHTAADKEWSAAAKKECSAALCRIDALESRLRLARDHYSRLLLAAADQKELIAMRNARNNACWTPSPPASPPASPRCSFHDPAPSSLFDFKDDLEVDSKVFRGTPSPPPPTWSPLKRFYHTVWHISHKAWNKTMHAVHGNSLDLNDIFLLVVIAALGHRLAVIGIHLLTACQCAIRRLHPPRRDSRHHVQPH